MLCQVFFTSGLKFRAAIHRPSIHARYAARFFFTQRRKSTNLRSAFELQESAWSSTLDSYPNPHKNSSSSATVLSAWRPLSSGDTPLPPMSADSLPILPPWTPEADLDPAPRSPKLQTFSSSSSAFSLLQPNPCLAVPSPLPHSALELLPAPALNSSGHVQSGDIEEFRWSNDCSLLTRKQ